MTLKAYEDLIGLMEEYGARLASYKVPSVFTKKTDETD